MLAANPGLATILADPYSQPAEFVLDNPAYGIDRRYIKSGGVSDPLKVTGNWASDQAGSLHLDQIASEINAGRPVVATNVGGIPELMDDASGRLVPPRDAGALATALDDVLAQPWSGDEIAARHSRSWRDVADDVLRVLERVLQRG